MRWKVILGLGTCLTLVAGTSVATHRHWVEPSPELLAAEGAGELVEGETRVLDSIVTPEGATVQLVTYVTTLNGRCLEATVETSAGPAGSAGGCGGMEEHVATLKGNELEAISEGTVNVQGLGIFLMTIGGAGSDVNSIRVSYSDGTSELRPVDSELRVWLAVSSPSRRATWEPVT